MFARTTLRSSRAASQAAGQFIREARSSEPQAQKLYSATGTPRRLLHSSRPVQATASAKRAAEVAQSAPSSNPALEFPCIDAREERRAAGAAGRRVSSSSGPEPSYTTGKHQTWHCNEALQLDEGGVLREFDIAYETWGTLNADRSNAILLHTGLSASSHAASTPDNPQPGWWEQYIGPGKPLDTDRWFVVCTNVLGGCYGSTGPASTDPVSGQPYGTRFPIVTLHDMVRAQFRLLDSLDIRRLAASVGASMGGMQSLAAAVMHPERVGRVVSVSGCARSHAYSVALRHLQRQALMMDPKWNRGFYYGPPGNPPVDGLKLARQIATVTYRSGPEWEHRFGRRRADPARPPALCPDFLIETYLDHAGDKFDYDANSLLYVSKAMDMFDLSKSKQDATARRRREHGTRRDAGTAASPSECGLTLPDTPYQEQEPAPDMIQNLSPADRDAVLTGAVPSADLVDGLRSLRDHPVLVLGVASDILFPARQQREIAEALRAGGNRNVTHVELGEDTSLYGHDTFLLSVKPVGDPLKRFLE